MPVIADTAIDPAGRPLNGATVEIRVSPIIDDPTKPIFRNDTTIVGATLVKTAADGTWTVTLPASSELATPNPTGPGLSHYEVRFISGSYTSSPVKFSMPASGGPYSLHDLTVTIPDTPATLLGARMGLNGGSGFWNRVNNGLNGNTADLTRAGQDLDLARDLGLGWFYQNIDWRDVEPTSGGGFTWTVADWIVDQVHSRGLNLIFQAGSAPSWANGGGPRWCPPTSGFYSRFAAYALALASRGAEALTIWNEPNNPIFWRDASDNPANDPTAYAALVKATYPTVHAAHPSVPVVVGLTAPSGTPGLTPLDFLNTCLGVSSFTANFDHWAHHPYQFSLTNGPLTEAPWNSCLQVRGLWTALSGAGVTADIWLTEFGATTDPSSGRVGRTIPETTSKQWTYEYYLAFLKMIGEGIPLAGPWCQYSVSDNGPLTSTDEQDHFGQVRYDRSEKAQVQVIRDVAKVVAPGSSGPTSIQKYYSTSSHAFVRVSDNTPVVLRGFNVNTGAVKDNWSATRWNAFGAEAAAIGTTHPFDHVRIAVNWPVIETSRGTFNWTNLDTQIARAEAAGFDVILDVAHVDNASPHLFFPAWTGLPGTPSTDWVRDLLSDTSSDGNYLLGYWRAVCQRYATDPHVIAIDLINEPLYSGAAATGFVDNRKLYRDLFAPAIASLRSGSDITKGKILMVSCISGGTAIPTTGAGLHTHSGSDYSSLLIDPANDFPTSVRSNVVPTFHFYYGGGGTEPGGSVGTSNNGFSAYGFVNGNDLSGGGATPDYNGTKAHLTSAIAQYNAWCSSLGLPPAYIGEFGISAKTTNRLAWIDDAVSVFDAAGMSRTWWEVMTGDSPNELNLSVTGTTPSGWDTTRISHILA